MTFNQRFRNKEDAMTFMKCLEEKKPVPSEIIINPFVVIEGMCIMNREYEQAPYELGFCDITKPTMTKRI